MPDNSKTEDDGLGLRPALADVSSCNSLGTCRDIRNIHAREYRPYRPPFRNRSRSDYGSVYKIKTTKNTTPIKMEYSRPLSKPMGRCLYGKMKKHTDLGLVFWVHLILIVLLWTSPFWLSWKLILAGIFVYYLQLIIFKDCILTKAQFETKKRSTTFYWYYLTKLGFKLDKEKVRFAADYYFPWIILGISLVWQVLFKFNILIG